MKKAFTLIELLVVIAILGVIATLAIQRLSGLKEDAQKKANLANLTRIQNAIDIYQTNEAMVNKASRSSSLLFNKLDSLIVDDAVKGGSGKSFDYTGLTTQPADTLMIYTNQTANVGLSGSLASSAASNPYAAASSLLSVCYLGSSEVTVLKNYLGISAVMTGYPERTTVNANTYADDEGSWVQGSANNPDTCSCVVRNCATGMPVAVINPGATSGRSPVGANIYRDFGSKVSYSSPGYKVMVNGKECADNQEAFVELMKSDGILVAFGIGDYCAMIGKNIGGFETAPVCPTMNVDEYRRYIVLFRLKFSSTKSGYSASSAEYAGVIDPNGNTIRALRNEK